MHKYGFAVAVPAGNDARELMGAYQDDLDGYRDSRKRMGITLERIYLMTTPMGAFVSVYVEADVDFASGLRALATSMLSADLRFLQHFRDVHGIDFTAPPASPPPELIADWADPDVHDRKTGLAFTARLRPGAADAARAFAKEAWQDRQAEFTISRRKLGGTRETVILNSTPIGEALVVYIEGDDPAEANRRFAASQEPFDVWFKDECKKIFPDFIDFNNPLPSIETLWDQPAAAAAG